MSMRLSRAVDRVLSAIRPYVPFTALNTAWRFIDKDSESILDVGCGKGSPMKFINRRRQFHTVGLDIFEPYIKQCRFEGIHDDYLLCDARNMKIEEKSFDVVLCLEMLEHLEECEGMKLLKDMEEIARKQVVISTPVGVYNQKAHDNNPHQEHRHFWTPDEMRRLGYKVRGCGLRNVGNIPRGHTIALKALFLLANAVWVLASPLVYYFPRLGGDMVCIKDFTECQRGLRLLDKLRFYRGVLAQDMGKIAAAHWEQFRLLRESLEPICGKLRGKTILDIGCGRYYPYTLLFHNSGNDVVGVDIIYIGAGSRLLERYWRTLRANGFASLVRDLLYGVMGKNKKYYTVMKSLAGFNLGAGDIDIRRMDAEKLDFPDGTFDLVVSNATFEHIHNVPRAVSELARVMKKGGVAYIGINLFTSLAGGHCYDYANPQKVKPWGHLRDRGHTAPVYLNKLRENEFVRMFGEKLEVLEVKDIGVGEGKEFLTPKVKAELSEYSESELLKRDIIIIARKRD
jgi:SAM-dependent methyltransferase